MEHPRTHTPQTPALRDILPSPGMLIARCTSRACGAVTPLDVSPELHRQIRWSSLGRLEASLRCTCGARAGALEPWPANLAVLPCKDRLYLFVA
jgi:hypothetical protein